MLIVAGKDIGRQLLCVELVNKMPHKVFMEEL
jgi:hypothetical protein